MQMTVLTISLVLMAVIAFVFVRTVLASGSQAPVNNTDGTRMTLIWGLLIVGAIVTFFSLRSWPHSVTESKDAVTINATGYQWYWEFDKEEVPVGKPVIFNVHTKDVTHGLGIVDPDGRLLFQTQAMPGYINRVEHVFKKPGTYRVLCMEFCGIAHHDMTSEIKVLAK